MKDKGQPYVTFPAGVKPEGEGIDKFRQLFEQLRIFFGNFGKKLVISSVTEENLKWMKEVYKDSISVSYDRDFSDYIYNSQALIELKGKKYHGKRNHIRHFLENEWSFEPLEEENIGDCIEFAAKFYNKNDSGDFSAIVEQYAINLFLQNMDYLGLKGGVLKADGKTIGFSIGEQLNSDTFVVHIEKSVSTIQGAYPMLCNQFAKRYCGDFKYINREEDMGTEGLRKSKMSYHPEFLLNKYVVTFNN